MPPETQFSSGCPTIPESAYSSRNPSASPNPRLDLVEKPHLFVVFVIEKVLKHILLSPKQSEIHKKSIHFRDLVFFKFHVDPIERRAGKPPS